MQSIFIEELPYLLFNNFNKKERLFVARINRSSNLFEIYYLFLKHRFYHLSVLFVRCLRYYNRNMLNRIIFWSNMIQFQEIELIRECFGSLLKTSQKGLNFILFYLFNFMKCNIMHIHRSWEYVTKCTQEYWYSEKSLSDKTCLRAVRITSGKRCKTRDVTVTYLDRSKLIKKQLTSIVKNIIHLENYIMEFSYDGLRTYELSINLYISNINAIGFHKTLYSKLYVNNEAVSMQKSGTLNEHLAA